MRERLVEERLSVGKREPLRVTQELLPRNGVESRTKAGLILFRKSHGIGVELSEQLRELRGNGPGLRWGDGWSSNRCRGTHGKGGA